MPETPRHPLLSLFHGLMPEGDKAWSDDATTRIQDFLDRRNLVNHANAQGDALINNFAEFKNRLVDMAHTDPSTTSLALDLVPGAVAQVVNKTGHPDADEHTRALTSHIQSEIARAGVQSYAIQDAGAARSALGTYGSLLNDTDRTTLGQFIDVMDKARAGDHQAQLSEEANKRQLASDLHAHSLLSQLSDERGDVALPNNWLRNMAADVRIAPETKAALWQTHDRLREGDVSTSDPNTVSSLLNRLASHADRPSPTEVLSHAGADLTLSDAQHLTAAAFPQDPGTLSGIAQLAGVVSDARSKLAAPENGPAGQAAFSRFVSWALPAARQGAVFDASHPDFAMQGNKMQDFAPRPEDNVPVYPQADRPTLKEIFNRE